MVIFKCPYCGTNYEMTTARLSFKQRSYAKEGCAVLNNDRKIGLIEQTAHGLHYEAGSIRIPVLVNGMVNCD